MPRFKSTPRLSLRLSDLSETTNQTNGLNTDVAQSANDSENERGTMKTDDTIPIPISKPIEEPASESAPVPSLSNEPQKFDSLHAAALLAQAAAMLAMTAQGVSLPLSPGLNHPPIAPLGLSILNLPEVSTLKSFDGYNRIDVPSSVIAPKTTDVKKPVQQNLNNRSYPRKRPQKGPPTARFPCWLPVNNSNVRAKLKLLAESDKLDLTRLPVSSSSASKKPTRKNQTRLPQSPPKTKTPSLNPVTSPPLASVQSQTISTKLSPLTSLPATSLPPPTKRSSPPKISSPPPKISSPPPPPPKISSPQPKISSPQPKISSSSSSSPPPPPKISSSPPPKISSSPPPPPPQIAAPESPPTVPLPPLTAAPSPSQTPSQLPTAPSALKSETEQLTLKTSSPSKSPPPSPQPQSSSPQDSPSTSSKSSSASSDSWSPPASTKRRRKRESGVVQCSVCKKLLRKGSLAEHVDRHKNRGNHRCSYCGLAFNRRSAYAKHILVHTGEKPFKCELCPKRYRQMVHLREHLRTHSGERPFVCRLCGFASGYKSLLRRHLRTHGVSKPPSMVPDLWFKSMGTKEEVIALAAEVGRQRESGTLPVPAVSENGKIYTNESKIEIKLECLQRCDKCPAAFPRFQALRSHRITAHGILKQHPCKVCNEVFSSSSLRRKHALKAHPLICKVCSKPMPNLQRCVLNKHMRTEHPEMLKKYASKQQCRKYDRLINKNVVEKSETAVPSPATTTVANEPRRTSQRLREKVDVSVPSLQWKRFRSEESESSSCSASSSSDTDGSDEISETSNRTNVSCSEGQPQSYPPISDQPEHPVSHPPPVSNSA